MDRLSLSLIAVLVAVTGSAVAKGDAEAGKSKAAICAACHGATGVSPNDLWPSLAAQQPAYMVKQLKAYRAGTRKDPLMEPMSKTLTDADIDNLAAYYAAQKAPPPGK